MNIKTRCDSCGNTLYLPEAGGICENCNQGIIEEVIQKSVTQDYKCIVCGINPVDVGSGEDTCDSCLSNILNYQTDFHLWL